MRAALRAWLGERAPDDAEGLERRLEALFRAGRLSLRGEAERPAARVDGGELEAEGEGAAPRGPIAEQAWVEIELIDERGHPQRGERYRVQGADGQVWEGHLDLNGQARVEGLDPDDCTVVFPWRDRDDFFPDEELEAEWIEVQLLRDDGLPEAGARYVAAFSSGVTRAGRLDERGRARVEGELGERCDLTFPDFDGDDLSVVRWRL